MESFSQEFDLIYFLEKIPLFSSIHKSQIKKISACFHKHHYKKNEIVFHQGEQSDAMYVIHSGAVIVEAAAPAHVRKELGRGDFFGEMALLSNSPRNATIRTRLDTTLFKLNKTDFHGLIRENKEIGLFLSRLYARRLSTGYQDSRTGADHTVFYAVSATQAGLGLSHFLYTLSYHVATESRKRVLVIEPYLELAQVMKKYGLQPVVCPDESLFRRLPPYVYEAKDFFWYRHESGFLVLHVNKGFSSRLAPFISSLMEGFKAGFDTVFFSLSHYFGDFEKQALRLCDKNMLLINNTESGFRDVQKKLARIEKVSGENLGKVSVGVSHLDGKTGIARTVLKKRLNLSETPQVWVERYDSAVKDRIDTQKYFPVKAARAVAREIAGVRVGLALGAGAARGWAHIGVLKVLQENGINIDMISGTSMGALVGAIFAAKADVGHLQKTTIDQFPSWIKARWGIFDYTIPLRGILRGNKALKLVAESVGHADFMDLLIPAYLVGVDILKGEEVLLETGDVSRAVRASLSLPGVFAPFYHQGRWMVDGGLLNPLPVSILEQKGADKIISVCVENPYSNHSMQKPQPPGILDVISRTIKIVHQRATNGVVRKSDVVIYPDIQGFHWDDFHKGRELMERGTEACEKEIARIKRLVGS